MKVNLTFEERILICNLVSEYLDKQETDGFDYVDEADSILDKIKAENIKLWKSLKK